MTFSSRMKKNIYICKKINIWQMKDFLIKINGIFKNAVLGINPSFFSAGANLC
jgi:hypothetical protein